MKNAMCFMKKAKLVYNRNAPKVVKCNTKSVVANLMKEATGKLKTLEALDDKRKT